MRTIWIIMIALTAAHLLLALGGAFVGNFSDGGNWWSHAVMVVVHPVAALALVALVSWRRCPPAFAVIFAALALTGIAADAATAVSIGLGLLKGDWWLPLVFSAIPVIGLAYVLARGQVASGGNIGSRPAVV